MKLSPERVCVLAVFVFTFCVFTPFALKARQGRPQRQMTGVPPDQALLNAAGPPPLAATRDARTLDAQNQLEVRMNVQRLYALASELKDEVDRTDSAVLSASVLKRAQDIEKLAKQIKNTIKR